MNRIVVVLVAISACGLIAWYATRPEPAPPESVAEAVGFAGLDEELQKKIWDREHFTFEIEKKFGKLFSKAIQTSPQKMAPLFLDPFVGSIPAETVGEEIGELWWQQATVGGGENNQTATAAEVAEQLVQLLTDFKVVDSLKLKILKIKPTAEESSKEHPSKWDVDILLLATGRRSDHGPISLDAAHRATLHFRDDEDIEQGNILAAWHIGKSFIRSAPEKFMQDITAEVGLAIGPGNPELVLWDNWTAETQFPPAHYNLQLAAADFDKDGFVDIAISGRRNDQYLLRSVAGKSFENVASKMGLPNGRGRKQVANSPMHIATWFDYNNDGYPDLILGDAIYKNLSGESFVEVTAETGIRLEGAIFGCAIADFDCDRWPDLYLLNHGVGRPTETNQGYIDDAQSGEENHLWRNRGDGTFEEVTATAGVGGGLRNSFAASWFFANEDHYPDLYVANDFGTNQLYINHGDGTFTDIAKDAGVGDFATSMGVISGDLDGDGGPEVYVANMFSKMGRRIIANVSKTDYPEGVYEQILGSCSGNRLYRTDLGKNQYAEISEAVGVNRVGWAYAPGMADFDADGFLDLYAATGEFSFDREKPDG